MRGELTKRSIDVCSNQAISTISFNTLLAKTGDPSLRQTDGYINLTGTNGRDHVTCSGREGDESGIETVVLLSEEERG